MDSWADWGKKVGFWSVFGVGAFVIVDVVVLTVWLSFRMSRFSKLNERKTQNNINTLPSFFQGKKVLIVNTGGLSGAVVARQLIDFGAKVSLFHLSPPAVEGLAEEMENQRLESLGDLLPETKIEKVDFAHDPLRLSQLYESTFHSQIDSEEPQNNLDFLIFAGSSLAESKVFGGESWEEVQDRIALNTTAPIVLTKLCLQDLTRSGGQIIVFNGSQSRVTVPLQAISCATQHGTMAFFQTLRCELEMVKSPVKIATFTMGSHLDNKSLLSSLSACKLDPNTESVSISYSVPLLAMRALAPRLLDWFTVMFFRPKVSRS